MLANPQHKDLEEFADLNQTYLEEIFYLLLQRITKEDAKNFLKFAQPKQEFAQKFLYTLSTKNIFKNENLNAIELLYIYAKAHNLKKLGATIMKHMQILAVIDDTLQGGPEKVIMEHLKKN